MSDFDLAVVGGGPGGYVAAERAAARGLKTVLVERDHLGGVCLNSGCIPTKTLIHSAKLLQQARGSAAYGVTVSAARYDFAAAMAWKSAVTERLRGGVAGQMERHGVTVERGTGMLTGRGRLTVDGRELSAGNVIVATGSRAMRPPIPGADLPNVVDSTGALQLRELPGRVVIVGGGYIGMEFACYFHAVGCAVVVVEMLDDVLAGVDSDIVRQLKSALAGVAWHLAARVSAITASGVAIVTAEGEREEAADLVLLATGRVPNTGGLGLEAVGAVFNRRGVTVDEYLRTNVAGLYAVGDVTGRSLLAHAASRMGEVAVDAIASPRPGSNRMRYHAVPWVVYTLPEIAGVGLSEETARAAGRNVRVARLPLAANGRFPGRAPGARLRRPRRAAARAGQGDRRRRQPRAARGAHDRRAGVGNHLRGGHHDRSGAAGRGVARDRVSPSDGVGSAARRAVGSAVVNANTRCRRE